jgi:hypothetical protein
MSRKQAALQFIQRTHSITRTRKEKFTQIRRNVHIAAVILLSVRSDAIRLLKRGASGFFCLLLQNTFFFPLQ